MELKASKLRHVGKCDPSDYPMAKKKQSLEYLREKMHLRARTNTISAVARIRNALAYATHKFFQENDFLYVHTPIITASDCEGAGEMFGVTTLLPAVDEAAGKPDVTTADVAEVQAEVDQQGNTVTDAKNVGAANHETCSLNHK